MGKCLFAKNSMAQRSIAILGSGAFATCVAKASSHVAGNRITFFTLNQDIANHINRERKNPHVYKNFVYPETVRATHILEEAVSKADIVYNCMPTQVVPKFLDEKGHILPANAPFVSCSKGMVISHRKFLSEIYGERFPQRPYAVLSGPSFAEEVVRGDPTLVVIASKNAQAAKLVQSAINSNVFRAYTVSDVIGVEVSGALKNVLAIGAGIVKGSGFGYNTMAAIVTRGAKEIKSLAHRYGADPNTINGLSGIGDMMLTAFGSLSRNQNFGMRLAKGESRESIVKDLGTVEGVPTAAAIHAYITAEKLDLPIIDAIYRVIYENLDIHDALKSLMNRPAEPEFIGNN